MNCVLVNYRHNTRSDDEFKLVCCCFVASCSISVALRDKCNVHKSSSAVVAQEEEKEEEDDDDDARWA